MGIQSEILNGSLNNYFLSLIIYNAEVQSSVQNVQKVKSKRLVSSHLVLKIKQIRTLIYQSIGSRAVNGNCYL